MTMDFRGDSHAGSGEQCGAIGIMTNKLGYINVDPQFECHRLEQP